MTFEKLSAKWESELRSLWKTVFGDEDEYISLFFDNYFNEAEVMGAIEGSRLVSMLFLLPMKVKTMERSFDAKYIYAVATLPEYRGRGISTKLLDETHKYLKKEGIDLKPLLMDTKFASIAGMCHDDIASQLKSFINNLLTVFFKNSVVRSSAVIVRSQSH